MYRQLIAAASFALLLITTTATGAAAQSREKLGYGRLINNDFLGDGHDRGHSGSAVSSRVRGFGWDGALPDAPGQLLEYRLMAGVIAPENLATPAPGDRPYAGQLSLGLHTHYMSRGWDVAAGVDLVVTGPQTGIADLQGALHDLLGRAGPSDVTRAAQIANGVHPTVVLEMGRDFALGARTRLRPFVEGRAGAETLIRAGVDLAFGRIGKGELLVRDPTTGQRYRVIQQPENGFAFVLGADIAKVGSSVFLPAPAYTLSPSRQRVRAGVHWQHEGNSAFYGLTWLGREFEGQSEGQVVGSIRVNLDF